MVKDEPAKSGKLIKNKFAWTNGPKKRDNGVKMGIRSKSFLLLLLFLQKSYFELKKKYVKKKKTKQIHSTFFHMIVVIVIIRCWEKELLWMNGTNYKCSKYERWGIKIFFHPMGKKKSGTSSLFSVNEKWIQSNSGIG